MEVYKTQSVLQNFIIIQNLFCINRSFLIKDRRIKYLAYFLFAGVLTIKTCAVFYDVFFSENEFVFLFIIIELVTSAVITYLANFAKCKQCFKKIEELDKITIFHEKFIFKFKQAVAKATVFHLISVGFDLIAFTLDIFKPTISLTFFIASAAQDSEFILYGLLMNAVNLRLADVNKLPINWGSKIYAHILITSANMSEDFTTEIPVLLLAAFFKIMTYMVYIILLNPISTTVTVYMICWQVKCVFTMWIMCSQSTRTKIIWKKLTTRLATKLVFDPNINKGLKFIVFL
ncbi:hypothetical protein evm_000192 [Chilo suppressalis]|nr:hypothetical protein evm_000192 [Chilo suppressalis]